VTGTVLQTHVVRVKQLCDVIDVRAGERRPPLLAVSIHRGVVPRQELTDNEPRADDLSGYKLCEPGDLVLNRMRAFQGAIGLTDRSGIVSPDYLVLRTRPAAEARFLHYLFRSPWFVGEMVARLRGIGSTDTGTVRTPRINAEDLFDISVTLPTIEAQRAIAGHLDGETARIDALIGAKRQMVELLEERWQGVLDLVIWGDGVSTTRVMHVVDIRRQVMYGIVLPGPDVGDEGIPIVKGGDVARRRLSRDLLCKTTREIEAPYARARIRGGDLVFAIRGGIGDVAVVPSELTGANLTQDVARVAPRPGTSSEWLMYALQSPTAQRDVRRRVTGATVTGLNIWELERVRIPMASPARQERDVQRLSTESRHLQKMRGALDRQIALLQEHRQALITAAVTGQIDVPGAS
jgi:type I restriction enzyme S subunit